MISTAATRMDLARPPGPARQVLFLVHRVPYPPDKGDRIVSFHLLAHLARTAEVDLAFLTDEPIDGATLAALARHCRRVEAVPILRTWRWARAAWSLARGRSLTEGLFQSPRLEACLARWLCQIDYDAVVCFSSGVLPFILDRGLEPRLIADLVDVDSQKWFDYAGRCSGVRAALFRLEGQRVQALEREAGRARVVVLATAAEADLYRRNCPDARVVAIPNGVDLDYYQSSPQAEGSTTCLFVGQLDYRANVLGLEWFCREAWPAIHDQLPEARFQIVGRDPTRAVLRLGSLPGVQVVGPVADVRPYLAAARVVAVPLPVARGIQNKVLEAMAMGRPVVASPAALERLAIVPGRDALAAESAADWVRCITELWHDAPRRDELGRHGRSYVETHHHWPTNLSQFDHLIGADAGTAFAGRGA